MIPLKQAPAIFEFAKKIFTFHDGTLLLLAAPGSLSLAGLLDALIAETPVKDLILPLLVAAICLSLYFITFLLDFASGIKAARHEAIDKKNYFTSAKGWSSIWKISIVSILVLWASFFSVLSAIAQLPFLPTFFMITSGTVAIMATLLDIYSIGENQKRLTGKKAKIFDWLENITTVINEGVTQRLKNYFKIKNQL